MDHHLTFIWSVFCEICVLTRLGEIFASVFLLICIPQILFLGGMKLSQTDIGVQSHSITAEPSASQGGTSLFIITLLIWC